MSKKVAIIMLLIISLSILTGCWSRREVDALAISRGVGVDWVEEQGEPGFSFTNVIIKPGEAAGNGEAATSPQWIATTWGETVWDAERNFATQSPRKLFLAHADVLVIGQELARKGILETIDFFERKHDLRLSIQLVIAQEMARDILLAQPNLENTIAAELDLMLLNHVRASKAMAVDIREFIYKVEAPGIEAVVPRVMLQAHPKQDPEESLPVQTGAGGGGSGNGGQAPEPSREIRVNGLGVFRKDRLVGWLNPLETRGLMWVLGRVVSGIVVVPHELAKDENGERKLSLEIATATSDLKVNWAGNQPKITIMVTVEGNVGEVTNQIDPSDLRTLETLQNKKATVIKNEIEAAIRQAQSLKADIFGFGQSIWRENPGRWKELEEDWPEHFANLDFQVEVEVFLRRIGIFTTPLS